MNAYLPHDPATFALLVALLALELILGFGITQLRRRRLARLLGWAMLVLLTVGVERLSADEPSGERMVAIILAVLFAMKAVVVLETGARLGPLTWLGLCMLWLGMRPLIFEKAGGPPLTGARFLLHKGLIRVGIGLGLVLFAWGIWQMRDVWATEETTRWLATLPLLIGLSLMLHFGAFSLFAAFWRQLGVDCRPLFRAPLRSTSLNEFWSKRWNLAFSEMTAIAIYRPVAGLWSRHVGLVASFIVSGLLHELAISVPVKAGYGGPTLYFLIHAGLVFIENLLIRLGLPIDRHPWLGRAWTLAALALPLPILFHRPFLAGIVWPLIDMG